jgi:molybdate/tungstate transport system substrate-binding protein
VGGAHPFVDPGGYRAHMIFELAQSYYRVPGLYNALLEHYTIASAAGVLGKDFSFQFTYEHSAAAAAQRNAVYRYARLPDVIDLSAITNRSAYAQSRVTIPGLGIPAAASSVTIVATPAAWGLTIPRKSVNTEDAIAFVNLLLGPIGTAALNAAGLVPITPALVSRDDSGRVPKSLKGLAIE